MPWALWVRAKTRWSRTGRMGTHIRSNRPRPAAARSRPPRPWLPCIAGTPYYRVSSTGRTRTTPGFRASFDKRQRVMERVGCSFTGGLFLLRMKRCNDATANLILRAPASPIGRPIFRPSCRNFVGEQFGEILRRSRFRLEGKAPQGGFHFESCQACIDLCVQLVREIGPSTRWPQHCCPSQTR